MYQVKNMNRFYCFMLLLMMSICDASSLNMQHQKLQVKKILSSLNKKPLKSIKSLDGDMIDCILVSHQPAFDHPSLKNHTIQMKPNYYPEELIGVGKFNSSPHSKDGTTKPITQLWHLNGRCPNGTVPVRRTKKKDIMRANSINSFGKKKQKIFSQLPLVASASLNSPTHEYAYVTTESNEYYGGKATISVWNPQVMDPHELSLSQIWVVGGPDSSVNTIEAGWMVSPNRFGDSNTRLFIYWTSDGYQHTGCYNLDCPGFVQTNNNIALGGSINDDDSQFEITILVWKDPEKELWWLKYGTEILGYWPASLFQYLTNSASLIRWGGEVTNSKLDGQHTTTQMGSGQFAEEGENAASYFRNLQVVDGSNNLRPPGVIKAIAEQPNCYNVLLQNDNDGGYYFFYGGPGRNPNCP